MRLEGRGRGGGEGELLRHCGGVVMVVSRGGGRLLQQLGAPAVKNAASKYRQAINAVFRWLRIGNAACEVLKKKRVR